MFKSEERTNHDGCYGVGDVVGCLVGSIMLEISL